MFQATGAKGSPGVLTTTSYHDSTENNYEEEVSQKDRHTLLPWQCLSDEAQFS